jgi:hypothetical protein
MMVGKVGICKNLKFSVKLVGRRLVKSVQLKNFISPTESNLSGKKKKKVHLPGYP